MQMKLGEKIRELRKQRGRTQEEVAQALGVTGQAVSRWESGAGYPDMEYIPAIANYFHVSIDTLFGYDNDRDRRLQAIVGQAEAYISARGDMTECVRLLRDALTEFPDEPQLMMPLGFALTEMGWKNYGARSCSRADSDYAHPDVEYNGKNPYWLEALSLYERLLTMGIEGDDKLAVITCAVRLYANMGLCDRAEAMAMRQDSIMISREVLLAAASVGENRDRWQGEAILALMRQLKVVMQMSVLSKLSLHDGVGAEKLIETAHLYESVFDDHRCGFGHHDLAELYCTISLLLARQSKIEEAALYFDRAFTHMQTYESIRNTGEYRYTAPLVSKVTFPSGNFPTVDPAFWQGWLGLMPEDFRAVLAGNERYREIFRKE